MKSGLELVHLQKYSTFITVLRVWRGADDGPPDDSSLVSLADALFI